MVLFVLFLSLSASSFLGAESIMCWDPAAIVFIVASYMMVSFSHRVFLHCVVVERMSVW